MRNRELDVPFICLDKSARSHFAEVLLRNLAQGKFQGFSVETRLNSELNSSSFDVLNRSDNSMGDLRSKQISLFQQPVARNVDFVFTVCDPDMSEGCPPCPGQPITGH
jgi:protein-tyrosine-phosphatase